MLEPEHRAGPSLLRLVGQDPESVADCDLEMPGVRRRPRRRCELRRLRVRLLRLHGVCRRDRQGVAEGAPRERDEAFPGADAAEARERGDSAGGEPGIGRGLLRVLRRARQLLGAGEAPLSRRRFEGSQAGGAVPGHGRELVVQWLGGQEHMRVEEVRGRHSHLPVGVDRPHGARQVFDRGRRSQLRQGRSTLDSVQRQPRQVRQGLALVRERAGAERRRFVGQRE